MRSNFLRDLRMGYILGCVAPPSVYMYKKKCIHPSWGHVYYIELYAIQGGFTK